MASTIEYRVSGVLCPPQQLALALSAVAVQYMGTSDPRFREFGSKLFAEMLAFIPVESLDTTQTEPLLGQYPSTTRLQDDAFALSSSSFEEHTEHTSQLPTPPDSSVPSPGSTGLMQTPGSTPEAGALVAPTVIAYPTHEIPVASSSSTILPVPGPGYPSPLAWTAPQHMAFQPLAPTVSSHVGPIRSASTHRRGRQAVQGVPYTVDFRSSSWGILPP
ncbi:hypothetical protein GY45DRAFT_1435941 [Cubamyces sp. BRFM 1775]|nr:hypothetical protein GY45DRAFT_1435941 [Cubamyces sp. BRFM 1775]